MSVRPLVGKYLPPSLPLPPPKEQRKASSTPKEQVPPRSPAPAVALGICRSESSFQLVSKLGEGTYGVVYAMKDLASDEIVAVKKIRLEKEKEGIPITALREISILKSLSHPNIVCLHEIIIGKESGSLSLVFEFVEHDLAALLDTMTKPFSEADTKCLVQQLLRALQYLHSNFVLHRDLKLANLLMSNNGQLKLADFGLARLYGEPIRAYTPRVVTLWYRAPELLLGATTYTAAVDMWGVGCVFGELLLRAPLLPGNTEIEQMQFIIKLLGSPNSRIWPVFPSLPGAKDISNINEPYSTLAHRFPNLSAEGLDLLHRLLTYDPERRITADLALEHPYWRALPLATPQMQMPMYSLQYRACGNQPELIRYLIRRNPRAASIYTQPSATMRIVLDS